MVSSKIHPKVNYIEKKTLDEEDLGHTSTLYVIDIYDIPTVIVLGKQKYTYSNKEIIFYPIYIVSDDKIKSQIGVFEAKLSKTLNLVDEDGDIDIEKMGEPLLYSFVTKKYIEKSNSNPNKYLEEEEKREYVEMEKEFDILSDSSDSDEVDVMKLKVTKKKVSEQKEAVDKVVEHGIFIIDKNFKQPPLLKEESESDADKLKLEYKESSANEWIEKFMRNNNYSIMDVESQGDCFFAVIREAFLQIGQKTTVQKLRSLLASHLTDEIYQEHRKLYDSFESEKGELKETLKEFKRTNDLYAKRIKSVTDKTTRENIINEVKKIKDSYKENMTKLKETEKLQNEYCGYMKDIHSLENFRSFILTSNFWADAWAISTLEVLLKVKIIILSEEAFTHKAFDNVLNCGEINKSLIKGNYTSSKDFEPDFYIMTSYSGNHYRLITYKKKGILTFNEIPYDIKILVMNKCLEKNSGIYYLIQDFRNFKSRLGLDPDEGKPDDSDDEEDEFNMDLYNNSTIFSFHQKSLDSAKPGKGIGEKIDKNRVNEFSVLTKIPNWRKKLSDSWSESPFTIERKRWASVEHYVQASKFKKGFPDFFEKFSLDIPSEMSKDPEIAIAVGDIKKSKYKDLRPKGVKIDVDYSLGREEQEREIAVRAKFSQNEDLKQLLLLTKNALLQKYLRRKPAETDIILMKIRKELK
jgi:predicted NAD-dependent protein-ADP-ribosyltransferase YbiA (DUF1768 family)